MLRNLNLKKITFKYEKDHIDGGSSKPKSLLIEFDADLCSAEDLKELTDVCKKIINKTTEKMM